MGQHEQSVVVIQPDQDSQTEDASSEDEPRLSDEAHNAGTGEENHQQNTQPNKDPTEEEKPICRICHCSSEDLETSSQPDCPPPKKRHSKKPKCDPPSTSTKFDIDDPFFLITPCFCTGTLQYVHHKCLQQWLRIQPDRKYCELCKYNFKLKTKSKPLHKWEGLAMSPRERRKLLFQLSFNLISIIFVFWSIYVIAERATHELVGQLGWRFWLKMLIVTIGFICGILFIFFQLKLYISTLVRWKQYNQIIIIENANNDQPMPLSTSIDLTNCETK